MWPKPTTRLGSLPALHQRGRARKLLVERTIPQYKLCRESRLQVLEGHFLPSMIGECRRCYFGLGGLRKTCTLAGARRIGPSSTKKEVLDFVVTPK